VNVKLLLDENVSPWAALKLREEDGVDAVHVREPRAREMHPGIVLMEEADLLRVEQLQVVRRVVAILQNEPDLVNRVLRIWLDGKTLFEEIPRP
jgi:hypothetical protein